MGNKKNLAVLATGSGKTYLACLAAYRLLNYTPTKRILFLVDRNNLARQTESEFSVFDRTEGQQKLGNLYTINRLKKEEDIKGDIVISTIQKLFCVLTGQKINDSDEDAEDEKAKADEEKDSKTVVDLGNDLKLPPDYFQLIMVDECHRSIYGKWKKVLDYFSGVTVLGLTATPTPEAYAYFNKNVIEEYTYDDSVVDGVNVPPVYIELLRILQRMEARLKRELRLQRLLRELENLKLLMLEHRLNMVRQNLIDQL